MLPFAMLCKSYSGDFEYAKRMVKSFNEFNTDEITLFIVVPALDLDLFESLDGAQVEVLSERLLAHYLVDHDVTWNPSRVHQSRKLSSFHSGNSN